MNKRYSVAFVVGLVLMVCMTALAAGDPTKPLWGWNVVGISAALGVIAPFLTSLISRSSWAKAHKRWLVAALAFGATVGVGIYIGALSMADLQPDVIWQTFATVFTVATGTYQFFATKFSNLTAATTKKK